MAYAIAKADVWIGAIEDRAGALDEKLAILAAAGANLEFVLARRTPEHPNKAVVFLAPIKGAKLARTAHQAGLNKSTKLFLLHIKGPDKPGLAHQVTQPLVAAGINLRGFNATALGRQCVINVALDCPDDATKALRILKKALK